MRIFKNAWNFRAFIFGSVKRQFQISYGNSLLGATWTILNPLALIIVYTVIFSQVMKSRLPGVENTFAYSIYLCSGILTWGLFVEIINRMQNIFLENANLLKKINFPKICLPIIVLISSLLNFAIIFALFTCFLILSGNFPGIVYLDLIPLLAIQICFSIGLGVIIGVLNVFFRDIGLGMSIIMQFWFWLTPIVYPRSILSDAAQAWLSLNPLINLIEAYQQILVMGQSPNWKALAPLLALSIVLCVFGLKLFRARSSEMVDEL